MSSMCFAVLCLPCALLEKPSLATDRPVIHQHQDASFTGEDTESYRVMPPMIWGLAAWPEAENSTSLTHHLVLNIYGKDLLRSSAFS